MSAPVAADLARELGARVRVFSGLTAAVRFFDGYRSGLGPRSARLEVGGTPRSRDDRERDRATYARLLLCFRALDAGVDDDDLGALLGPTLAWISGHRSMAYLADEVDLSEHVFSRWVVRGERALEKRLMARGLLRRECCPCGCGVLQVAP